MTCLGFGFGADQFACVPCFLVKSIIGADVASKIVVVSASSSGLVLVRELRAKTEPSLSLMTRKCA